MKKLITLAVLCVGALALLPGCLKDKEPRNKKAKAETTRTHKSKEIIEHDLV